MQTTRLLDCLVHWLASCRNFLYKIFEPIDGKMSLDEAMKDDDESEVDLLGELTKRAGAGR